MITTAPFNVEEHTREKALEGLTHMAEIVLREQLIRSRYMAGLYEPPKEGEPICGGAQFCAIGALWIGSGEQPVKDHYGNHDLVGVREAERAGFVAYRPHLALALAALNQVCAAHAERYGWAIHDEENSASARSYEDPVEALFESNFIDPRKDADRDLLLRLILDAKDAIRNEEIVLS